MMRTDLAKLIRVRADQDNLPEDHELRKQADAFDEAVTGYFEGGTVTVKAFLRIWVYTRKMWCEYSGEPLI